MENRNGEDFDLDVFSIDRMAGQSYHPQLELAAVLLNILPKLYI